MSASNRAVRASLRSTSRAVRGDSLRARVTISARSYSVRSACPSIPLAPAGRVGRLLLKPPATTRPSSRLRAEGLEGPELQLAFIAEIERIDLEASIIAHEGRHAIESRYALNFLRPGSEREFLAKLSEVAFSSAPFLAIGGGILTRNTGDGTSHGKANERIMRGLVAWMRDNGGSIPVLPQLDRLTDDQLRAAFRSLDPAAPGN